MTLIEQRGADAFFSVNRRNKICDGPVLRVVGVPSCFLMKPLVMIRYRNTSVER